MIFASVIYSGANIYGMRALHQSKKEYEFLSFDARLCARSGFRVKDCDDDYEKQIRRLGGV